MHPFVRIKRNSVVPTPSTLTLGPRVVPSAHRSVRFFRRAVLHAFEQMPRGQLVLELPGGELRHFGALPDAPAEKLPPGIAACAQLTVHCEAFFQKCFWSGDIGFAESFIDGDWTTPDLPALIAWFILNVEQAPTLSGSRRGQNVGFNVLRLVRRLGRLLPRDTRAAARRNISEHYDLSNDFFALWLDPSMMYSAARWPGGFPDLSLAEAQRAKNEALCRALRLQPSDHVLEIGTGWGGWSIHAARTHGCRVTTVTISQRQFDLARQRVAAAGLAERVDVQFRDFRDIAGTHDKIVSIEMLEAIGHRQQETFARVVSRALKPEGLLALQFITCPDARYDDFRRSCDFIQRHIFPGSLLLSLNRVNTLFSHAGGFVLHQLDDFGRDYARTLRLWRDNFAARQAEIRALGFDERFLRKWNYYLAYCEAAFAMRNISVVHTLHTRANNLTL